jgi:hypothetical protein
VSTTGLFTAGSAPGAVRVRATSVADPRAFGDATVTVVTPNVVGQVAINSGRTAGMLEAFVIGVGEPIPNDATVTSPISDVAGFQSTLNTALAGVTKIGAPTIQLDAAEAVALQLDLRASLGALGIGGSGCSVSVSAGDVRSEPGLANATGMVGMSGCLSRIALTVGDVEKQAAIGGVLSHSHLQLTAHDIGQALALGCTAFGCGKAESSTIEVHAANIGFLTIGNSVDSRITVGGRIQAPPGRVNAVDIQNNRNLDLGAPLSYGDVVSVRLNNNTFASSPHLTIGDEVEPRDPDTTDTGLVSIQGNTGLSLAGIAMGNIAGDLAIVNNHGLSDADAQAFAAERTIAGSIRISGNVP